MGAILDFYTDAGTDHKGRSFSDLLNMSDVEIEESHDCIQWLFPLTERSQHFRNAPVLDGAEIAAFRKNNKALWRLQSAYDRYLAFLGLAVVATYDGKPLVEEHPSFFEKQQNWLTPRNHNFLRITRVLKCLRLMGIEGEAKAFFAELKDIYEAKPGVVGETTFDFWREAAGEDK